MCLQLQSQTAPLQKETTYILYIYTRHRLRAHRDTHWWIQSHIWHGQASPVAAGLVGCRLLPLHRLCDLRRVHAFDYADCSIVLLFNVDSSSILWRASLSGLQTEGKLLPFISKKQLPGYILICLDKNRRLLCWAKWSNLATVSKLAYLLTMLTVTIAKIRIDKAENESLKVWS